MTPAVALWAIPVGVFCVYLIANVVLFQVKLPDNRFRALYVIFFLGIPLVVWLGMRYLDQSVDLLSDPQASWPYVATTIVFAWFLYMGYLQFFFIFDRSVSVQIHTDIFRASNEMSFRTLSEIYGKNMSYSDRLAAMCDHEYLKKVGGRFHLTGKGRALSLLANYTQKILNVEHTR